MVQPLVEPGRQCAGPTDQIVSIDVSIKSGDGIQSLLHQESEGLPQLALGQILEEMDCLWVCGGPGQRCVNGAGLEQGGLVPVQDIEVGVYRGLGGVSAEDLGAEGVDSADVGPVQGGEGFLPTGPLRQVLAPPFGRLRAALQPGLDGGAYAGAHLAGRLFGESDSDDGAKRQAGFQQRQVAADQRASLAGASASGDDEGTVWRLDGVGLLASELVK